MPRNLLLIIAFCSLLTATSCWMADSEAVKTQPPQMKLSEVLAVPPPPEPEPVKVSILTKPEKSAAGTEEQDINAEFVDGVIVIKPKGAIREIRNEEKDYRVIKVLATGYCPCKKCCGRMTGLTSTESNAWKPGIAVAPSAIPYGSLIQVPGYERAEWAIADDTGEAMRNDWKKRGVFHIDVRFTYHWEAREWGRQILEVKIKKPKE